MADEGARLTLSEERLHRALAEMELRLRIYFDDQLKHKADTTPVLELQSDVRALNRGDWPPAFRRALAEFVEEQGVVSSDRAWTARERIMGAFAVLLSVIALVSSLYFSSQAGASPDDDRPPIGGE